MRRMNTLAKMPRHTLLHSNKFSHIFAVAYARRGVRPHTFFMNQKQPLCDTSHLQNASALNIIVIKSPMIVHEMSALIRF